MKNVTFLAILLPSAFVFLLCLGTLVVLGGRYFFHPARNGGLAIKVEVSLDEAGDGPAAVEPVVRECAEAIRGRLRAFVGAEPRVEVDPVLPYRIRVEIPAVEPSEVVPDLLVRSGVFELKLAEGDPAPSREELLRPFGGVVPAGLQALCPPEIVAGDLCLLVRTEAEVTNRDIEEAHITMDDFASL